MLSTVLPATFQRIVALLLAVVLFCSAGCATAHGPLGAVQSDGTYVTAHDGGQQPAHLERTGHHGGKVAAWVFVGMLLAAVVVVDLVILPATHHDPFPCCRAVIHICD
ncbi:MAG: hypothetical protein AB7N76_26705 [Planctomycetota bacterium]